MLESIFFVDFCCCSESFCVDCHPLLTVDRGIKTLAGSESSVGLGNPTFDQQEGDVNQQSLEMLDKLGYTLW